MLNSSLLQKSVNYGNKKFYNTSTMGQCYKTFYGRNLRIFIISQSVCPSLVFAGKAGAHMSEATFRCSTSTWPPDLTHKYLPKACQRQTLQLISKFHKLRKKFYSTGPRGQCFKTFYGRNLRIFIKSQSVCPWQAFPA